MHKSRIAAALVVMMLWLSASLQSMAQGSKEPFSLGVSFGPSVPSDAVSAVYGALDTLGAASAYDHASKLGFHAGARVRFGLGDNLSVSGSASAVRFAGQDQTATLDNGQVLKLQTATTLVPVTAGITAFALRGLLAPYITAEASYTYRTVSVATGNSLLQDIIVNSALIELEPSTTRIGAAAAAGVQFDLGGLRPFVEVKYHWTNLVGTDPGEGSLNFVNVSLGLLF